MLDLLLPFNNSKFKTIAEQAFKIPKFAHR